MPLDKATRDSLEHMRRNPTTGTPHNQQVISTQVEEIYAIDRLEIAINDLKNTITSLDKKSGSLEKTVVRLTYVGVGLGIIQILVGILSLFHK